jgi:hypothetical protein
MGAGRLALVGLMTLVVASWPAAAHAGPVNGSRETVEIAYTTTAPGTATGFTYAASFRNPAEPGADPPPLRRLVIRGASGATVDTGVTARCAASDADVKQRGQAACPAASRLGSGTARVKVPVLPAVDYRTTLFNADRDQLELLEGNPPSPPVVVHGYVRGEVIDSPIPTCINGGYVPTDCPTDQAALAANRLTVPALVTGSGAQRKAYMTTPRVCPASRKWQTPVTFVYGDGVTETLVTEQPCVPLAAGRPRLTVALHVPRAAAARHLRGLRVAVRASATARLREIRAAVRRVRARGRPRPVLGSTPRPLAFAGRRLVTLRLRAPGLAPGRYEVAVRGRGAARVTRRFTIR